MSRAEIVKLIPHAGSMCLLDGVLEWDAHRIRCVSRSHRDAGNPLRVEGSLPVLCGVEYAAQAMAVHGGLAGAGRGRPRAGYLASLRNVVWRRTCIDDLEDDLVIEAERLAGDGDRVIYRFSLQAGETEILSGQAAVVLVFDPKSS